MAGDWIKMRTNLWDDPRVAAICDHLDIPEATAVGGLYRLWAIADEHSEDGTLPALTATSLDRKVGVKGFAETVESVGWLTIDAGFVSIVRFDEHNGKSAKRRSLDAQRKANSARDAEGLRNTCGSNADKTRKGAGARPRPSIKPISSPPTPQGDDDDGGSWKLLDSALTANGVREINSVRKSLQCSVAHALAAVKHYASKPGAWKPEQLVVRLKNLRDSQDVADETLWMPVDEKWAKAQRAKAAPRVEPAPDRAAEKSRKDLAELESRYGEELNAMSDVDRDALAVGLNGAMAKLYKTNGWKSVRTMLLELMRRRDGPGAKPPTVRVFSGSEKQGA